MAKIITLIDGSIYAESVSDYAAWAATRIGASVDLLHVLGRRNVANGPVDFSGNLDADIRDTLLAELAAHDQQSARLAQLRGRAMLEQAKTRLTERGVDNVTTKLRRGDLVETILEFETESDLVVIGKRGEAADFAKLHLGSNLERVVRSIHKPILVASRAFSPVRRFLAAFDGGPSAGKAVSHIATSRLFHGLECHLVTVGTQSNAAQQAIDTAAAALSQAGYQVTASIIPGQADEVIAAKVVADQIDLLVMGAYGHSRVRNLIIGSTTTEMLRSCKIPVVLIR